MGAAEDPHLNSACRSQLHAPNYTWMSALTVLEKGARDHDLFPSNRSFHIVFLLLATLVGFSARGQNVVSTGALSGQVTDQRRAVVPEASVVVEKMDTGK